MKINGYGNRVSSLIFGPKHVIVTAGVNKAAPNLKAAILKAKTVAAPLTMLIFKRDYTGYGELMQAAESGCGQVLITQRAMVRGRIKVILVGENLGY